MYYILFYKTIENYIERREPYRKDHLKYVQEAHLNGKIVMAGALSDPVDSAVLIFNCESAKDVEEFALNDPYVINGLIINWEVRPWTVVICGES